MIQPRSAQWSIVAASLWLLLLVGYSLTLALPNNHAIRRGDLLSFVPDLLDLVAPLPPGPDDSPQDLVVRNNSGWRYFPQRLDLLTVAAIVLAGAWGAGSLFLRALRVDLPPRSLEQT